MRLNSRLTLLMRIHSLINRKGTGTPIEFASRLNVSRATLFRLLKDLREAFSAPINYSKTKQSYYYEKDYQFHVSFGEWEPQFSE